jgi:hypothetical protein
MIMGLVVVMVDATLDLTEAGMLPSVLVRDVAEYAEFKVTFGFARVEVEQILSKGARLSPGSRHSLKGEWESGSVCTCLIWIPGSEFRL